MLYDLRCREREPRLMGCARGSANIRRTPTRMVIKTEPIASCSDLLMNDVGDNDGRTTWR